MNWKTFGAIAALVIFGSTPSLAERPLRSDDPYPVGLHRWETAGGIEIASGSWEGVDDRNRVVLSATYDYGLTRNGEFGGGFDIFQFNDPGEDGFGDAFLHYKHLMKERTASNPDIALDFLVVLPTASSSKGLGSGQAELGIASLYGWKSQHWTTTARLGVLWPSGGGFSTHWQLGLSTRYQAAEGVNLLGEIFYDTNENSTQESELFFSGGVAYEYRRGVILDALISVGGTNAVPDVGVRVGARIKSP